MIYSLTGTLLEKTVAEAVIECNGVGYLVVIPSTAVGALPAVGGKATLYTHMHVSENAVALFGFASKEEKELFKILTGVSGVGPKVGIAIISAISAERISLAISAGDYKTLTSASGVGPKLAQRIVLELKDKISKSFVGGISAEDYAGASTAIKGSTAQALAALAALGYSPSEAAMAISKIDYNLPVPEIIRLALQGMGGKR